jgi:hypothetical protein
MEKTPVEDAIVAFIDILGYEDLVNRLINDLDAIKIIDNLLQGTSSGLIEAIRTKLSIPQPYDEYSTKRFHSINARYISDTILITLQLSKTEISSPHFNEEENLSHCIFSYLYFITMACTIFIGKTGGTLCPGLQNARQPPASEGGRIGNIYGRDSAAHGSDHV